MAVLPHPDTGTAPAVREAGKSDCINGWNDWLKGWDGWKYDHIDVKIVGWAVLDKSVLQDLQPDEVVYDSLISDHDSTYDTSNGVDTIPDKLPSAPSALSRFDHFADSGYSYPGGLDKRFDMYLWGNTGLSQHRRMRRRLGTAPVGYGVPQHAGRLRHSCAGTRDRPWLRHDRLYGGEGESTASRPEDSGGENSLMMAGSAMKITDFDGWMLRYMWSKIKDDAGRF